MSVLTETAITSAGIDRASEFLSNIPNVTFIEDNAGEVYVNIRGQTSVRNSDPNVAVVIDGATLTSLRSEEHTSELQSLMRISYAVFCLKNKKKNVASKTDKTHI